MGLCSNFEDHTIQPKGYIEWHAWAKEMGKTHKQRRCTACGLYAIWEPKGELLKELSDEG
jgi:hypothetical protein